MRFRASASAILVILLGSMVWGEAPQRPNRRVRNPGPQQAADFAPDPPPVPEQSPTPQPGVGVPAQQPAVQTPAPVVIPTPAQVTPPENLPPATPPQVTFHD